MKKNKNSVTLKDISKRSGYSVYTVSRALNDEKDVSDNTKQRILEISKELGYIQNVGARNLRLGKSKNIAIIFDDFLNPYYSIVIKKLSEKLLLAGYNATLFYGFDSIAKLNEKLMNRVISNNVDGIISLIEVTKEAFSLAENNNMPVVQHGSKSSLKDLNCISFDDFEGGKLAANYLIKQGKKRIAFIGPNKRHTGAKNRCEGYKRSLLDNNIPLDENLIIYMEEDNLDPIESLSKLLNFHVDGIIAFNDYLGYEIARELNKFKISDIAIVGFDNLSAVYPFTDNFVSVSGNLDESTRLTAECIIKLIEEGDEEVISKQLPMKIL